MWFSKRKELNSKEFSELKQDLTNVKLSVTSLEASFSNLTNQVLKKIRKNRAKLPEDDEEEEDLKNKNIYKDVFVKEK